MLLCYCAQKHYQHVVIKRNHAMEENYIQRCFDLARMAEGRTSPNPMVGAVLVHQHRIIGEGYHAYYGSPHAEVNAVASVKAEDRVLIPGATLYVSLQPCSIFGKTPPCTDLIIREKIKKVVISCLDHTPEVLANGLRILSEHGIEVIQNVLKQEGEELALPRNRAVQLGRPYLILKMALSIEGNYAPPDLSKSWLSNPLSRRLSHRWRAEADAILIGTNSVISDDPALDNRFYFGKSPLKIILDQFGRIPSGARVFQGGPSLLISQATTKTDYPAGVEHLNLDWNEQFWQNLLPILCARKIGILLIEGGGKVWDDLLNQHLWDEIRILQSASRLPYGILAPKIQGDPIDVITLGSDLIKYYKNAGEMLKFS
jgi:diaminohydroxyphosphoribosylaminopyrimidine deaminase / 5-amino-6-(5-phosphoribosylamino)uracil reductase